MGGGKGRQPRKGELSELEASKGNYRLSSGETLGASTGRIPESIPPAGQGAEVFIHPFPSIAAGGWLPEG